MPSGIAPNLKEILSLGATDSTDYEAEATRHTMLQKAFGLIDEHGYKATSIDDILAAVRSRN